MRRNEEEKRSKERGFTLIETAVVIVAAAVLLAGSVDLYSTLIEIQRRQQGIAAVDLESVSVKRSLSQLLAVLPARELSYSSGQDFLLARLPQLSVEGSEAFPLAATTPLRIEGNDALAIVYGRRNAPRLELVGVSRVRNGEGIALAAAPGVDSAEAVGLKAGDLMLLAGPSAFGSSTGESEVPSRLIRLRAAPLTAKSSQSRKVIEFRYDLCGSAVCSESLPQLSDSETQTMFAEGSALVPVNLLFVYLKPERGRNRVTLNEGGRLALSKDEAGFEIEGGSESSLGEADELKISYLLEDGSREPTPDSPNVEWIDRIKAVRVELSRSLPLSTGERATRRTATDFRVAVKNID